MKIKPEHYEVLAKSVNNVIQLFPGTEMEYRAAGFSPMRLRWDLFWASGLKIGQSHNAPDEPEAKAMYLPIYDYANDDHVDTALRAICKQAGFHYGAAKTAADHEPLKLIQGQQYLPSGAFFAEIVAATEEDHESPTREVLEGHCCIRPDGRVLATRALLQAAAQLPDQACVRDIVGREHELTVSDGVLKVENMELFVAYHSDYEATTHTETVTFPAGGADPVVEIDEGIPEAYDIDTIMGAARNHTYSEFTDTTFRSTDPSGTRDYYEHGREVYHCMTINKVNGNPATPEQVAALGKALGLHESEELRSRKTQQSAMRMG